MISVAMTHTSATALTPVELADEYATPASLKAREKYDNLTLAAHFIVTYIIK